MGQATLVFDTRLSPDQVMRENGLPYTDPLNCADAHLVVITAMDGCGEMYVCEIRVRLTDYLPPRMEGIPGDVMIPLPLSGGDINLWAIDLAGARLDDCTGSGDFLYSFSASEHRPVMPMGCPDYPAYFTPIPYVLFGADGGRDLDCDGVIHWSERNIDTFMTRVVFIDNAGICCNFPSTILAGHVRTVRGYPVRLVRISLEKPMHIFPEDLTGDDGAYLFNQILLSGDVEIHAARDDDHRSGISTLDLVRLQKHLLGRDTFTSVYQSIAADVNRSESVSAIDLVELRKLILGKYQAFPDSESWRFFDAASGVSGPLREVIIVDTDSQDTFAGLDFVGVKIGDVNLSATGSLQGSNPLEVRSVVRWAADDRTMEAGDMVHVPIRALDAMPLGGCQFTLDWTGLSFAGVEPGVFALSEDDLGIFEGNLTASWYDVDGVRVRPGDVLFTLVFRATERGRLADMLRLSSRLTEAEAYTPEGDLLGLSLAVGMPSGGLVLFPGQPNPVSDYTDIQFSLPQSGRVSLTVTDMTGRILLDRAFEGVAGMNVIRLDCGDLQAAGTLAITLRAGGEQVTGRIVLAN